MSKFEGKERRKHQRYETDVKIQFRVNFELNTKIQFALKQQQKEKTPKTYTAMGKNVNVEGICFCSPQKLVKGEELIMDVYLPAKDNPIRMEGRVRWCAPHEHKKDLYDTGVKVLKVRGEDVEKTIGLDPAHHIQWSIVLESVFGGFKENIMRMKKSA